MISTILNAKPSKNYGVALHAEFTDEAFQAKERPYINVCPCDIDPVECKRSNIFIDIIDDECHGEAAMAAMEAATESDYSKRLDYVQTKMKFMFDNEESMAETSEMLVQNCYSRLKHAGIVSCKEKFTDIKTELNPSTCEEKITFFLSVFLKTHISSERYFWSTGKSVRNTTYFRTLTLL